MMNIDTPTENNISIEIEKRLRDNLSIDSLEIIDESEKHKGHAGYRPGGQTHFKIKITSPDFKGMSKINMHKIIYKILDDLIKTQIHAISLFLSDK